MNWLLDNWLTILGASSVLGAPLAYIFGGRDAQKKQLKKDDVEIKVSEIDYTAKVSDLYESMMSDIKDDRNRLKEEKEQISATLKEEREYFRTQLDEVRASMSNLQHQVNEITLQYSKEVERSQTWEKLHRELGERYSTLEKEYFELKDLYDKLKKDFEAHKKKTM